MSGESPAAVLYSSDGIELNVVSGAIVPTNTRALLISGRNPAGDALYIPTGIEGNLGIAIMSDGYYVQSDATVTTSGSALVTLNYFGTQEIALVVNVGTVTGAGSITYTIQELDPGDGVTVYGNSASTTTITSGNAPGVFTAVLPVTTSSSVQVSWTVSGTFSATIYSTITTKSTPYTQTVNGTVAVTQSTSPWVVSGTVTANQGTPNSLSEAWPITITDGYGNIQGSAANPIWIQGEISASNPSVGTDGAAALGFDTQVGAKVVTTVPTYSAGNLQALTMDVGGNLRVVTNKASTSNVTTVTATTSSQTLLAANLNRVFAAVYNGGSRNAYILLGSGTASPTNYSIVLLTGSYWEIPVDYIGQLNVVWSSSGASALTGSAYVTELSP
jgi:hypothetical protein